MKPEDYKLLETLLKKESGLVVTPEKTYLLESRLTPVALKAGLKDIEALVAQLRIQPPPPGLIKQVVDAMTTNETFFFRDTTPFERFKTVLMPLFLKSRVATKTLRIWSAACSSGQEPYSLCMILKEMGAALDGWRVEIVATDLSDAILSQAREGAYTQFEVQRGLPIHMLVKYFTQDGQRWKVKDDIKTMVQFKPLNLLGDFSHLGTFDIIFCRNVLIYFDVPTKAGIFKNLCKSLKKDGALMLGGAETVMGISEDFKSMPGQSGIYIRTDGAF